MPVLIRECHLNVLPIMRKRPAIASCSTVERDREAFLLASRVSQVYSLGECACGRLKGALALHASQCIL